MQFRASSYDGEAEVVGRGLRQIRYRHDPAPAMDPDSRQGTARATVMNRYSTSLGTRVPDLQVSLLFRQPRKTLKKSQG